MFKGSYMDVPRFVSGGGWWGSRSLEGAKEKEKLYKTRQEMKNL